MDKYVIVSFINKNFPQTFLKEDWPLHTTLHRPFTTPKSVEDLVSLLKEISSKNEVIKTIGKSREMFGSSEDVPVTTLEVNESLQNLHNQITTAFNVLVDIIPPEYPVFRPHVTDQKIDAVQVGQSVLFNSISLVHMNESFMRVLSTFKLQ